jgi:hypothetical protein
MLQKAACIDVESGIRADTSVSNGFHLYAYMREVDRKFLEGPSGYRSTDEDKRKSRRPRKRDAWKVAGFCLEHDIPYSNIFVSIALLAATRNPVEPGLLAMAYCMDDGDEELILDTDETKPLILRLKADQVSPELMVVCDTDFKTQAINRYEKHLSPEKVFADLTQMRAEERAQALFSVTSRLLSGRYAEARMHRGLRESDVEEEIECYPDERVNSQKSIRQARRKVRR